ncbi:hypothetical protein HPP92_007669 [Vanilla planifolia]|uniref:Uncharacterized protein n=1 Tax=Vanilla planifolia TaxID=51239 RepID=A0A835V8X9_VANPL|nr:hypothetical protein HPP92_007669 [Vanilla planifolia]
MASQSTVIACSAWTMVLSMALRFVAGPALMAIPCYAEKMRGRLLSMAIIQAALPQGIVPFVFAKDYGVYPEVLSTGFGIRKKPNALRGFASKDEIIFISNVQIARIELDINKGN